MSGTSIGGIDLLLPWLWLIYCRREAERIKPELRFSRLPNLKQRLSRGYVT